MKNHLFFCLAFNVLMGHLATAASTALDLSGNYSGVGTITYSASTSKKAISKPCQITVDFSFDGIRVDYNFASLCDKSNDIVLSAKLINDKLFKIKNGEVTDKEVGYVTPSGDVVIQINRAQQINATWLPDMPAGQMPDLMCQDSTKESVTLNSSLTIYFTKNLQGGIDFTRQQSSDSLPSKLYKKCGDKDSLLKAKTQKVESISATLSPILKN